MSEMEGGCDNFSMPLKKEMSLWEKSELRIQGAQDDQSTATLPADRKVNLTLYPSKKVTLPAKRKKIFRLRMNPTLPVWLEWKSSKTVYTESRSVQKFGWIWSRSAATKQNQT